ncbi:carbon-nitrogen hydrolase family protein [Kitasatospora sp. GP82]|uniref:carbon-nitrogen hydrolase family protein n=1 Tax=Kitasatospora sp. GP82 TaxID=3035089 RepID=UPI0024760401|nr:carbon-nitrogen hydrolase family protein [Kitasatospora sp. GP82]MDH6125630.1 putative amidohydrolase [Kitasatospora sp. GP82]
MTTLVHTPPATALPTAPLTIATAQAALTPLDVPANAAIAADLVLRAGDQGAQLLLLSELFLTGYELAAIAADPGRLAIATDDPRLDALATACTQTGTSVVVGAPVVAADTGLLHIAALVLDGSGRLATVYRKQFTTPSERAAGFSAGTEGCTVQLRDWRLGLGVCWDCGFPEHARAAALDGAHAYLVGSLLGTGSGARQLRTLFPARAMDNTLYTVLANHIGPSGPYVGCGSSGIWGPDGTLLADAGTADPGLVTATLDPAALAHARAEDPVLVQEPLHAPPSPRTAALLG